jgi:periplasmic nitrate reductase NapD
MPFEQHISSLLVHARPDRTAAIDAAISGIAGAEIHGVSPEGKLIVTLETDGTGPISDALSAISSMDGVLAATLVFHYFDTDSIDPNRE